MKKGLFSKFRKLWGVSPKNTASTSFENTDSKEQNTSPLNISAPKDDNPAPCHLAREVLKDLSDEEIAALEQNSMKEAKIAAQHTKQNVDAVDWNSLSIATPPLERNFTEAEIMFLKYLDGKATQPFDMPGYWTHEYHIDMASTISDFFAAGLLTFAPIEHSLKKMTVKELKEILSSLSLPVSGKKADLISRLISNGITDSFHSKLKKYLAVTDAGRNIISSSLYLEYFKNNRHILGISLENASEVKRKFPKATQYEIARYIITNEANDAYSNKDWGLYRNGLFRIYKTFSDEGQKEKAMHYCLMTTFMDGAGYSNGDIIDEHLALVSPALLSEIKSYYGEDFHSLKKDYMNAVNDLDLRMMDSFIEPVFGNLIDALCNRPASHRIIGDRETGNHSHEISRSIHADLRHEEWCAFLRRKGIFDAEHDNYIETQLSKLGQWYREDFYRERLCALGQWYKECSPEMENPDADLIGYKQHDLELLKILIKEAEQKR